MENKVLAFEKGSSPLSRAAERSLERRREAALGEVMRLVEAALRLIRSSGTIHQPRVSEIVREAGLSNQAFYRHFRSKHELLVTVLDEGIALLARTLARRMNRAQSSEGRIREWLRGLLEQALNPDAAEATRPFVLGQGQLDSAWAEEMAQSQRRVTAPLRDVLERAAASGELPGVVPERDAESLYHLAMGWVQARLIEGGAASREDARRVEDFAWAGLRRSGAAC